MPRVAAIFKWVYALPAGGGGGDGGGGGGDGGGGGGGGSGGGGGGSGGSGGNDKQKSKNSSKKTTKNLKTNQPFVVADDMLIGTKRSIPWQRGHEKWGVTELIRALRGDNRSFGFQTTTVQVFSQTSACSQIETLFLNVQDILHC